ncbi:unnamed protein product [Urochloa humidicola]
MDSESKSPSLLLFLYGILIFLSSNNTIFSSAQPSNSSEADRQALLCIKSSIFADPASVIQTWCDDSLNFLQLVQHGPRNPCAFPRTKVCEAQRRTAQLQGGPYFSGADGPIKE